MKKTCTHRSLFVQSFDQTARTSPSTFLFLLSSQCQRTDPRSTRAARRGKPIAFRRCQDRSPTPREQHFIPDKSGTKAHSDLKANSGNTRRYSTSLVPGIYCKPESLSTPFCIFLFFGKTETRKPEPTNNPARSVPCRSSPRSSAPRSAAVRWLIRTPITTVNTLNYKTDFWFHLKAEPVENSKLAAPYGSCG